MAKTLSLSEVKTRLPELVTGVQEREEEVVVTENGRPAAVLINVEEYTLHERDAGCAERSCLDETDRPKQVILLGWQKRSHL